MTPNGQSIGMIAAKFSVAPARKTHMLTAPAKRAASWVTAIRWQREVDYTNTPKNR